jgi:hypothetical protein
VQRATHTSAGHQRISDDVFVDVTDPLPPVGLLISVAAAAITVVLIAGSLTFALWHHTRHTDSAPVLAHSAPPSQRPHPKS